MSASDDGGGTFCYEGVNDIAAISAMKRPFLRLLAINLAAGVAAAILCVAGLLWLDPFGLRPLMLHDASGHIALALLCFGFIITFGSCAMGTAIMRLAAQR